MKMKYLLILFGCFVVLISLLPVMTLVLTQNSRMTTVAIEESEKLAENVMETLSDSVYELCKISHENVLSTVKGALSSTWNMVFSYGDIVLAEDTKIPWSAENQYTGRKMSVSLPEISFGGIPLEKNNDPEENSMVVDEAVEMWGVGTCTIFQRMNSAGDMLRIATNIVNGNGQRAIGTYIPAINPNGDHNKIIASVLKGKGYYGKTNIFNTLYIGAYEPIFIEGKVVGVLYYGIEQDKDKTIHNAVLNKKVGTTGYVTVLDSKGNYIISNNGQRDGENIIDVQYDGTTYPIRDILNHVPSLAPGESGRSRFYWKDSNNTAPRMKNVHFSYFQEWDWIICISAWEDELLASKYKIESLGKESDLNLLYLLGSVLVITYFLCLMMAKRIVAPIQQISGMIQEIAQGEGDLTRRIAYQSQNELGELAGWFNLFMENLQNMIRQISGDADSVGESAHHLSGLSTNMSNGLEETADNAEKAARTAENIVVNITDIAATVKQSSTNSMVVAESISEMNGSIEQIAGKADDAKTISQNAVNHSEAINTQVSEFGNATKKISKITEVINEIAEQTNLLALNATIEAARAGDAGKGFAVVATEIKTLAKQTAEATYEIRESVTGMEETAAETIEGIKKVQQVITESHHSIDEIAAATEDQSANAQTISENVHQIAEGLSEVSQNISESSQLIGNVSEDISQIDRSSAELSLNSTDVSAGATQLTSLSKQLTALVRRFKI